jgi:hypothetical protein
LGFQVVQEVGEQLLDGTNLKPDQAVDLCVRILRQEGFRIPLRRHLK